MKGSIGLLILFVSVTSGILLESGKRNVTKILKVSNGGQYGYWSAAEYCPPGTFASSYMMKNEANQFTGDDTAMNAIKLTCTDTSGHAQSGYQITSGEGPFGTWSRDEKCNQALGFPKYLVGFSLQVEGPRGNSDDTSANYIKFSCRDYDGNGPASELSHPPGTGVWGSYGSWSYNCDRHSAICGLATKVESSQGGGDDTGLNDVIFYCCSDAVSGSPLG